MPSVLPRRDRFDQFNTVLSILSHDKKGHDCVQMPPMASRTGDTATIGVEPSAGGCSSPAYLNVIFRLSDIVIGTF